MVLRDGGQVGFAAFARARSILLWRNFSALPAAAGALASDSGGQAWLDSLRRVCLGEEREIEAGAHVQVNAKRILLAADLNPAIRGASPGTRGTAWPGS